MAFSCASMQANKPLTAKQQAAVWMQIYNQIYDDTMTMAKNPKSTPVQKELVAKKKLILSKIWPLLRTYIAITDAGGTPPAEQSAAITDLITELTSLAGGA
jgi:hypothetical protein